MKQIDIFTFQPGETAVPPLFVSLPDTDFRDYLDEVVKFADSNPDIIEAVQQDLDNHALEKKTIRMADKQAKEAPTIPGLDVEKLPLENLSLETGRPRTPAFLVFILSMLRGFLGSLANKEATRFMSESITLYNFLLSRGFTLPARTTIIENVNQISHKTMDLIFKRQILEVLGEGLDDFKKLTIDSTSIWGDTEWPTDGKMMIGLIERAFRVGGRLGRFGLTDFVKGHLPRWIHEMNKIEFEINLAGGKKGANRKRKKLYDKLLKKAEKAVKALLKEYDKKVVNTSVPNMLPSRIMQIEQIHTQLRNDLADAQRVIEYTRERIFEGKVLPAREKVLSLSDGSAAYIVKGDRDPVIGYKPQITRSVNGFIADLTVPEGNAADSAQFVPCILNAMNRTEVVAELVSSDDGYSSKTGKETLEKAGVKTVSISGAKGKKITDPEEWENEVHRDARRNRSAVESLMYTLKDGYKFGRLSRRGIDAARSELSEKALAYNFCRKIEIRKRQNEPHCAAA